jgi:hypothetical protein
MDRGECDAQEIMSHESFPHEWRVDILTKPPLIAPARQHTYPLQVAGEEDALARGALFLMVHPATAGTFLATCALGFTDPTMPTGVFACPNPSELCAVAGGYAYVIDTAEPSQSNQIPLKPVTQVIPIGEQQLLLFVGFHAIVAWGASGLAWQTRRLSWEGVRVAGVEGDSLRGFGWNLMTDKEVEFTVDLKTGAHVGGGF